MPRIPISKGLRFDVFKRDGFQCQYCGAHPPSVLLEVDHINPVKLGGDNQIDNLITACQPCNRGKSAKPLNIAPKGLAEKAAETAEREAQVAEYSKIMEAARDRLYRDAWRVAEALTPGAEAGYSSDRLNGIVHFVKHLGVHEVLDAVNIANAKHNRGSSGAFKYFCGICWRKIRDLPF
jgi:hypothetical protein